MSQSTIHCTCGHFQNDHSKTSKTNATSVAQQPLSSKSISSNNNLDASFVHLISPLGSLASSPKTPLMAGQPTSSRTTNMEHHRMKKKIIQNQTEATTTSGATDFPCGGVSFVETHRHLENLLRAAQGRALPFDSHHLTSGEATTTTTEHYHHQQHDDNDDEGVYLCLDCIERVAQAVDRETDRLYEECRAYHRAVELEEERWRTWSKAVSGTWNAPHYDDNYDDDNGILPNNSNARMDADSSDASTMMQHTMESFQKEVQLLQDACQQQELEELGHLKELYREQLLISSQLDQYQLQQAEEENVLQAQGRDFDCTQAHQTKRLQLVLEEVQALEQVDLLNHVMIEWKIPQQQLQQQQLQQQQLQQHDPYYHQHQPEYARVNDLRLAYAANNHHHLEWEELEAAWSLVAQCVLWVAALTNFSSQEWRIVPLTKGPAKLIQYQQQQQQQHHHRQPHSNRANTTTTTTTPSTTTTQTPQPIVVVYNLGRPNMAKSLCAFQVLLYQLMEHVIHLLQERQRMEEALNEDESSRSDNTRPHLPRPPFPSTPTQIGSISLESLLLASTNDHADVAVHQYWTRAIYYMACNLQWMCDQTSLLVQRQQEQGSF